MEACLSTLKTIMHYPFAPYELIHSNVQNISRLIRNLPKYQINENTLIKICVFYLLEIAADSKSCRCQAYVTHILIPLYNAEDQINLYQAGILGFLAKLIVSNQTVLQIPALKCLGSICFSNKLISDIVCSTLYVFYIHYLVLL